MMKLNLFAFPATFTPDKEDGGFDDNMDIPLPTQGRERKYWVPVPLEIAWKAEIHKAMVHTNISISRLASQLHVDKDRMRRLLNPHYRVDQLLADFALHAIFNSAQPTFDLTQTETWQFCGSVEIFDYDEQGKARR